VHFAAETGGHAEAGQRIEDRGLTGARKTNKADFDGTPRASRESLTSIDAAASDVKHSSAASPAVRHAGGATG
jgi:hypothetical protein